MPAPSSGVSVLVRTPIHIPWVDRKLPRHDMKARRSMISLATVMGLTPGMSPVVERMTSSDLAS